VEQFISKPKERPILFSGPMVRAILDGRKRRTRRVVSPHNSEFCSAKLFWDHCDFDAESCFADNGYLHVPCHCQGGDGFTVTRDVDCGHCQKFGWEGTRHRLYPKWGEGDRLWVREAFDWVAGEVRAPRKPAKRFEATVYRADGGSPPSGKWTPSIHMPRWASRLTLVLESVLVERLQEIDAEDVDAEGVPESEWSHVDGYRRNEFAAFWEQINGAGSWKANPWVWVLGFRVEANA
jgi:hypothetical protein